MADTLQKQGFWQALGMAWELGYIIAIPIVILGLGGRFLDKRFDTSPWLFLAGVLLSIVLTSFGLVWKFKKLLKDVEQETTPPTSLKK
ncbi:MAG: AtpZ/AtpI family protein [bacterium]|nr:AtpZ/AtpI family protein [bacterium]